jgi:hypothetical protein
MSRVTIVLEDNEQGNVTQTVSYTRDNPKLYAENMSAEAGFDKSSPAHMYSVMMLKFGSDIASDGMAKPANDEGSGIILLG